MTSTWSARMIKAGADFAGAPLLRRQLRLDAGHGGVVRAQLRATALGVFQAHVSGFPVSDEVLSPGWSSYEWRLRFRTYDVTSLVRAAGEELVLGLSLGRGWAVGRLGWNDGSRFYADAPAAMAELDVQFEDGHRQVVGTDGRWQSGPSMVLANDLYNGETIDARLQHQDWLRPDAELLGWTGVEEVPFDNAHLVPYTSPVVRRQEVLRPRRIWTSPAGRTLVDFGQNLVGWIRLSVTAEPGAVITVRHAEVLEHEELGVRPLRTADATDRFICSGGSDVFEPTLTFHGFRYAEVEGYPRQLTADDLEAVVVHTDLERIGSFECANADVNQLHHNAVWGLKGNFLDVPTDCPQRDERLGWTGDLAVVAPTAAYLFDVREFLDNWMQDLAAEQAAVGGRVPYVVPDLLKLDRVPDAFEPVESAAIWADVAAWLPWALWQAYGDAPMLARHLPVMLAHCRHVAALLSPSGLWDAGFQFGDWLDPDAPPEHPADAKADKGVVATASLYRSLVMTAVAARLAGSDADAQEMEQLAQRVHAAFQREYVYDGGFVRSDCQTVYALAIQFGLLDAEQTVVAGRRLAELVREAQHRISTGFAGTPYVLDALTSTGYVEDAYRMLLQPEVPGWMYQVGMGATTMWERWDSMLPDGSINPGQMTSFNHYAFGSVADWLHRVVLGIAPGRPGYAEVRIAPQPGGGITWARGSLRTPRGEVAVSWREEPAQFVLDITLPEGVPAQVCLPDGTEARITGGAHQYVVKR